MTIELLLPAATPSLNKVLRCHWAVRKRLKASWSLLVLRAVGNSGNMAALKATGKRHVTVVRFGKKVADYDNLVGGCKSLLIDNLVAHGLLVDDSPTWLECEYLQDRPPKGEAEHTRVILRDAS